ncbi:MAG: hypothetical protein AAF517_03175, partial [Planctomycetota bacterium]
DISISEYQVAPGRYEITLLHPDFAPDRFSLDVGDELKKVYRTLRPGGRLRVLVRSGGEPVAGAVVSFIDADGRDYFDDRTPYPNPIIASAVPVPTTDDAGTLSVDHARAGNWRCVIEHAGVRVERELQIASGETTEIEIDLASK